jgi:hypothetical protein
MTYASTAIRFSAAMVLLYAFSTSTFAQRPIKSSCDALRLRRIYS